MHFRRIPVPRTILLLIVGSFSTSVALAQPHFVEDFENNGANGPSGPTNLVSDGWIFRNQSDPAPGAAWYDGDGFGGEPFEGAGYLASSSTATDFFGGALSVWAILPALPTQQAGDVFSIRVLDGASAVSDTFFEIRYSPTGGTSTGSGPTDVGDFTELMGSTELPYSVQSYYHVLSQVPGSGRIAIRFWSPFISTFAGRGAYIAVDSLTVGDEAGPTCGAPMPESGGAVVWSQVDSPFVICENLLVPEGAVLQIDPGVTVEFEEGNSLRVEGELIASGAAGLPVIFSGAADASAGINVVGNVRIENAEIHVPVSLSGADAAIEVRDALVGNSGYITGIADIAVVEDVDFVGGSLGHFTALAGSLRIVNCDFSQGATTNIGGLLYLDNITIDGEALRISGETVSQPTLLENLQITNNASGAGISLYGANYLVDASVVTSGNQYPLEIILNGAGLLPGSTLPATGNAFNYIPVEEFLFGADREWADTGIPYVVDSFADNRGGNMKLHPGVNVKFLPGAGAFIIVRADLRMDGTPEEPIVLESFDPAQPWFGLKWIDDFNARARYVEFDGAQLMIQSDGGELTLDHCTIRNGQTGYSSVTGGIVHLRNSIVANNNIGLTTTQSGRIDANGTTSPNIFAGNGLAVDYNNTNGSIPAFSFNWWNDATGPTSPNNPGGSGDAVEGLLAPWFTPYLDAAPSQADQPPIVDLTPVYYVIDEGDKVFLQWSASDDSEIVSQRVEFAQHGFPNEYQVIAELPADARTFEFIAPLIPPSNLYTSPAGIRVVAVDDAGQETWSDTHCWIPYQEDFEVVMQSIDVPTTAHPHDRLPICWFPGGTADVYVALDGVQLTKANGGAGQCLSIGATLPYVSTDLARILVVTSAGAGGREVYSFSDYFTIRPDERYGDVPPLVELTAPADSAAFASGGVIPIRWNASDDEGLRSFSIQASYNGGRLWHYVARDLPSTTRAYDWQLPQSTGVDDLRIRIVAKDWRFNIGSDDGDRMFAVTAGASLLGDLNCDSVISVTDIGPFVLALTDPASYAAQFPACNTANGDVNQDGIVSVSDIGAFVALLTGS